MNNEILAQVAEKKLTSASPALSKFRSKYLGNFKAQGMKETSQDSYKFTNLETFFSGLTLSHEETNALKTESKLPAIFLENGKYLKASNLPEGLVVKNISDELKTVEGYLKESNALSNLHHSMFEHGVFIEVAKKAQITSPVRIINNITRSDVTAPTHFILANSLSKVTFIEEVAGETSHALISETYINALDGALVEHIALNNGTPDTLYHSSVYSDVARDATVRSFIFHNSGKMNRTNLELNLNEAGSNGESYALFLTNEKEHSDINTVINHKHADTTSNQIAKGILDNESKGVFTGKIHIFPKAQRVASGQLNKNLLLSKKAQVHSQPQLEIFADDVKCSHGSTTGQLSPEEVFYFEARGIPAEKARNLLAFGFGLEVVQKIQNKDAQDYISGIIKEMLVSKFSFGRVL